LERLIKMDQDTERVSMYLEEISWTSATCTFHKGFVVQAKCLVKVKDITAVTIVEVIYCDCELLVLLAELVEECNLRHCIMIIHHVYLIILIEYGIRT